MEMMHTWYLSVPAISEKNTALSRKQDNTQGCPEDHDALCFLANTAAPRLTGSISSEKEVATIDFTYVRGDNPLKRAEKCEPQSGGRRHPKIFPGSRSKLLA